MSYGNGRSIRPNRHLTNLVGMLVVSLEPKGNLYYKDIHKCVVLNGLHGFGPCLEQTLIFGYVFKLNLCNYVNSVLRYQLIAIFFKRRLRF